MGLFRLRDWDFGSTRGLGLGRGLGLRVGVFTGTPCNQKGSDSRTLPKLDTPPARPV